MSTPRVLAAAAAIAAAVTALISVALTDEREPSVRRLGMEAVFAPVQVGAHAPAVAEAPCPAGKVVTGGGAYSNAVASDLVTFDSIPLVDEETGNDAPRVWRVRFQNRSDKEIAAGAVAMCAVP